MLGLIVYWPNTYKLDAEGPIRQSPGTDFRCYISLVSKQ